MLSCIKGVQVRQKFTIPLISLVNTVTETRLQSRGAERGGEGGRGGHSTCTHGAVGCAQRSRLPPRSSPLPPGARTG